MLENPPMSRRDVLATASALPLASLMAHPLVAGAEPRTFVLVHGAWHGGWCWKKVVPLLREAGHRVATPTLTGLGERAHLLTKDVGLDTHVADVLGVLESEDLRDVALVGHSYGGMVVAAVAERAHERLSQLIYLDAFLPDPRRALSDYAPVPKTRDDGWRVPPPGPPSAWGVTDAVDVEWMRTRIGDQPVKTFTQAVQKSAPRLSANRQAYLQCTKAPFFVEAGARAKERGFRYRELMAGGHDAMVTQPVELARALVELS